ncbi:MAG: glycoside hydrolase family 113, partial [Acidimicrobiales bacterium]
MLRLATAALTVAILTAASTAGPLLAGAGPAAAAQAGGARVASAGSVVPGYHTVSDGTAGKVAGAAIENLSTDSINEVADAAEQLRASGMNTLELDVWWKASSPTADTVEPYVGTVPDAVLETEISVARAAGLKVVLTPLIYCNGCQGGFRGVLAPANHQAFFASYSSFIDHFAGLAQASGVSTLFVGSEMSSLEADTAGWMSVIAGARREFHRTLAYEENWSVLGQARFLGAVDEIGVSAYFPLDGSASPSLGRLLGDWRSPSMAAWRGRNWVSALAQLSARYHRPIVFGEAGYLSGDYAAAQPFLNYYSTPNEGLQADLYQALLETF